MQIREGHELVKVIDKGKYIINLTRPKRKPTQKELYNLHKFISKILLNKYLRQQNI